MSEPERLQKFLARAGVASRRACERLIEAGRVRVNGVVVTELGAKVDPLTDAVELDGQRLGADIRFVYLLVNKPTAVISAASDPEGRPVVTSLVPREFGRLYPVGRLDWDSEGAIILTNDGMLTNLLTHPRHEVQKTYMAKVRGIVANLDKRVDKLREGVVLDGKPTLPAEVARDSDTGRHTWFVIGLREGRNRQVRRMFEAVGLDVIRLRRVAYGPVNLADLAPGDFRRLSEEEVEELYEAAGSKRPSWSASRGRLPVARRAGADRAQRAAGAPPALTGARATGTRGPKASGQASAKSEAGAPGSSGPKARGESRSAPGPSRDGAKNPRDRRGLGDPRRGTSPDARAGAPPRDRRPARSGDAPAPRARRSDAGPTRRSDDRPSGRHRDDTRPRSGPSRPPSEPRRASSDGAAGTGRSEQPPPSRERGPAPGRASRDGRPAGDKARTSGAAAGPPAAARGKGQASAPRPPGPPGQRKSPRPKHKGPRGRG